MAARGTFSKLKAFLVGGGVNIYGVMVVGANANTNIAISGLKANAQIIAVLDLTTPADLGAHVSKVVAGNFQLDTTSATKNLFVIYAQKA